MNREAGEADRKFRLDLLSWATGVSRPKIRQILEIARQMEQTERVDALLGFRHDRGRRFEAEHLDGGCTVIRPERFQLNPEAAA